VTALLFTVGKFLIGYYLGKSNVASSYGAAASIITILLWIYYSSLILLFGAEFTKAYAESRGSRRGRRTAEP
jgi:membrane protein